MTAQSTHGISVGFKVFNREAKEGTIMPLTHTDDLWG
jgi:hypothetical protein